jgi:cytochrome o ubiquinol oxidase subunit 2
MAMPGMQTQLNVLANNPGEFRGVSANISGEGFAGMNFKAKAVSEDDFNAWIASVKKSGPSLTHTSYQTLAAKSSNNPATYYSMVDSDLYTSIINSYMSPDTSSHDMQMGAMTP